MSDILLQNIASRLTKNLPRNARHAKIRTYGSKNSVRLYYPEFDSSHYEVHLARESAEIAFSFTGGKAKNAGRLALFETHLFSLQQKLGHQLVVEPVWQANWARVYIAVPKNSVSSEQAEQYADVMLNFLDSTYPVLCTVFEAVPARSRQPAISPSALNPKHYGAYAVLSRHLNQIRAFLQGQAGRPTDDVLCDWVQLCYAFELFQEGARLFDLIDQSAVHPWHYDRTRRQAKVCRLRAKQH
jgi:hypothetical protein